MEMESGEILWVMRNLQTDSEKIMKFQERQTKNKFSGVGESNLVTKWCENVSVNVSRGGDKEPKCEECS